MDDDDELDTGEFDIPVDAIWLGLPESQSSKVRMDFGATTHPGKQRDKNEDAYIITRTGRYWERIQTSIKPDQFPELVEEIGYAMAVADGIGGSAAGDVASSLALQCLTNLVLQSARWGKKLDNPATRDFEIEEAIKRVEKYFRKTDEALIQYAEVFPKLKGMGTTVTGAYIFGTDLFTIHVGDSRAYLYRGNQLYQLTKDQTFAQFLADVGDVSQEGVRNHNLRHNLSSCLGGKGGQVNLEITHYKLLNGDKLLFCTDGLTEMVNESEIAAVFKKVSRPQGICDQLIELALNAGGLDNVTVLTAFYSLPDITAK
jgi:serine/threonine protein phosphatase PrpC